MSILQSDAEVVRNGRRNKLGEEAKLSVREQIVEKLHANLEENDIGNKLSQAWAMASMEMTTRLNKQTLYLNDLDNFDIQEQEGVFGGQSALHLPTSFTICKTYHARFMSAILDVDPPFSIKARREDGTDRVQVAEDLIRYALLSWANNNRGIEEVFDSWIWNWCTTGTGILKMRWKTSWDTYLDVQDKPVALPPIVQTDEQGNQKLVAQWDTEEVEIEVTKKTFDGPQFDFVQMEDFCMVGGKGDPDLADKVFYRTYMTASDLWTKVDQGVFREDAVEKIIKGGPDSEYSGNNNSLKIQRASEAGQTLLDTDVDLDRYEIIECCFKHDINGSGINSDIVAWFDLDTSQILGCTYLRRIMPSGERPYSVIHFHKRPDQDFGLGLLEILNPLTRELDAMHNIRMDNALFQSVPFFFYRASSSLDAENFQVQPGMGIPVDNPQTDVVFPNVGNRTSFTSQEEQVLQGYIEKLTGISDISLGVMTGVQGPTRTATGARLLNSENNNNLSVHLRRLNAGVSKVLRTLWHMLQNRVEPGFAFRITGDDGQDMFRQVWDTDLALDIDFELSANTSHSNKSVTVETAQQLVQMNLNPLMLQLGLCGPDTIYAAYKNYLSALGVKDFHRYLKKPADYTYIMSASEEFNRVIRKEPVQVSMNMDHSAFIAFTTSMLESQRTSRTLNPEQEALAIQQMRAHQQMQAALEQMQAQAAMQNQIAYNATQSQTQAPAQLNTQQGNGAGQVF